MEVTTRIDEELGLAIREIRSDLAVEEIEKAQQELYVGPGFDPAKPRLWDATRGNVAGAVTGSEMQQAASRGESLWGQMAGGRTAILVERDADIGMGRTYEQMATNMPRELGVFRDRDEAPAWLLERAGE